MMNDFKVGSQPAYLLYPIENIPTTIMVEKRKKVKDSSKKKPLNKYFLFNKIVARVNKLRPGQPKYHVGESWKAISNDHDEVNFILKDYSKKIENDQSIEVEDVVDEISSIILKTKSAVKYLTKEEIEIIKKIILKVKN